MKKKTVCLVFLINCLASIAFAGNTIDPIISLLLNSGSGGGGLEVAQLREDVLKLITGNTYYLDALNGNDDNSGISEALAWQTLSKAQAMAHPGDGVMLLSGNYGEYVEDFDNNEDWCHRIQGGLPCNSNGEPSEKKWTVYINQEGAKPVFSRIRLHYPSPEEGPKFIGYPLSVDSYLVFFGKEMKFPPA